MTPDYGIASALAIGFLSISVWLFHIFNTDYYLMKGEKR